mgnify:FL=1
MLVKNPEFPRLPTLKEMQHQLRGKDVFTEEEIIKLHEEWTPKKVYQGIYTQDGGYGVDAYFGAHMEFEETYPKFYKDMEELLSGTVQFINCYGVCDSPEQFKEALGKRLEEDPRVFIVVLNHIAKKEQPPKGGWRWHKWGPYIGKGNPEHEYIYDEVGFDDGVWLYQIYDVTRISKELNWKE